MNSYWFWILIILFAVIIIAGKYRTKNLPPMQKELSRLFYSFVAFGGYIIFLALYILFGNDSGSYVSEINNLQEAKRILQDQSTQIQNIKNTLFMFFIALLIDLLPSIYNFAKVVIPKDNEKILNLDSEETKPILNLTSR